MHNRGIMIFGIGFDVLIFVCNFLFVLWILSLDFIGPLSFSHKNKFCMFLLEGA